MQMVVAFFDSKVPNPEAVCGVEPKQRKKGHGITNLDFFLLSQKSDWSYFLASFKYQIFSYWYSDTQWLKKSCRSKRYIAIDSSILIEGFWLRYDVVPQKLIKSKRRMWFRSLEYQSEQRFLINVGHLWLSDTFASSWKSKSSCCRRIQNFPAFFYREKANSQNNCIIDCVCFCMSRWTSYEKLKANPLSIPDNCIPIAS